MTDSEKELQIDDSIEQGDVDGVMALMDENQIKKMMVFGTWLHVAAKYGQLEIVKRLVAMGADVNVQGGILGGGPIKGAASEGHTEIVKFLIAHGAKLDTRDPNWNPLFGAIYGGHIDVVKLLIENGIDTKVKYVRASGEERDAWSFAVDQGKLHIAALLADKNSKT